MKSNSQNKGSAIQVVIAVIAIAILVGAYLALNNRGKFPVGDKGDASSLASPVSTSSVSILVPNDLSAYEKATVEFVQTGSVVDPQKKWLFVSKVVAVNSTGDVIRDSAEAAAEYIPTQAGTSSLVVYLKVVDGTAYVVLNMDIDGWAGVSAAIAQVHPIVEKTLRQFSEIKAVKFSFAPGDSIDQIMPGRSNLSAPVDQGTNNKAVSTTASSSITVLYPIGGETLSVGQRVNITWKNNIYYPKVYIMVGSQPLSECPVHEYTMNGSMGSCRGWQIYDGPNTGSYLWTVPSEYPDSGSYVFSVWSDVDARTLDNLKAENIQPEDYSKHFVITDQNSTSGSVLDIQLASADWKTFTNSSYAFSFKYPLDWRIESSSDLKDVAAISPERTSTLQVNPGSDLPTANIDISVHPLGYRLSGTSIQTTFNGIKAYQVTQNTEEGISSSIYIDRGQYTYQISPPKNDTETVILSTFKFTN